MNLHHQALIRFEAARKRLGHTAILTAEQVLGLPVGSAFETAVAYAAEVRAAFLVNCEEGWADPVTPMVELCGYHPVISHTTCTGNTVLRLAFQKESFNVSVERPNNIVVTEGAPFDRGVDGDPVVVALLGDVHLRPAGASFLINEFGIDPVGFRGMGQGVTRHEGLVGRYYDHRITTVGMFRVYEHPDDSGMAQVDDELAFSELIINGNSFGCPEVVQTLLKRLAARLGTTVEARRAELAAKRVQIPAGSTDEFVDI